MHAPIHSHLTRMPAWIRQDLGHNGRYPRTAALVRNNELHTVCEEARCPNRGECWSRGTATFMLLGNTCTRACAFCAVKTGRPASPDVGEPQRVADAVIGMGLTYVVLTSVNRDDLADGGADTFAATLCELRRRRSDIGIEFLTPDFRNCQENAAELFAATLAALPDGARRDMVWGHNVETVPRLYRMARQGSRYERSLRLLEMAAAMHGVAAKSALMLGLGENRDEVLAVLADLRSAGVERMSFGQYLCPSRANLPVERYLHPEEFAEYENAAREMGFTWVKAGPLVRSSYYAEEFQQGAAGSALVPET